MQNKVKFDRPKMSHLRLYRWIDIIIKAIEWKIIRVIRAIGKKVLFFFFLVMGGVVVDGIQEKL